MDHPAVYGETGHEASGLLVQELAGVARRYPVPQAGVMPLLAAGVVLGALGDALLRAPGSPGLNLSLWIAAVAVAAVALHRRAALALDRERVGWLSVGVLLAAGLAWRDAEVLKFLAVAAATLTFALAAHRRTAGWVRRAGIVRYAGAFVLGALHACTATVLALVDARRFTPRVNRRTTGWRGAAAVARGLALAAPFVMVFGALFISADDAFEHLVVSAFRFNVDYEWFAGHIALFLVLTWISTGYLRGFLTGTDLPSTEHSSREIGGREDSAFKWPVLGATEAITALAAIDLLFLAFVLVQFRYLFGADTLVQVTPNLTYADYARHGFFELVTASALVAPVLLAADWLLDRRTSRDVLVFRLLAAVQIALVLAIAASALQRLRLYHASYGLTESRFYGMVLLFWITAMLLWLAATVLRGRRDAFAFGTLASGLATIAMLFVVNPDGLIARANVARMVTADARVRFDVAYATSLSADAVPVLIDALPVLPADVQCPLARHMLRRWPPERYGSMRSWRWSSSRAARAIRDHETQLRLMVGPDAACTAPTAGVARK